MKKPGNQKSEKPPKTRETSKYDYQVLIDRVVFAECID